MTETIIELLQYFSAQEYIQTYKRNIFSTKESFDSLQFYISSPWYISLLLFNTVFEGIIYSSNLSTFNICTINVFILNKLNSNNILNFAAWKFSANDFYRLSSAIYMESTHSHFSFLFVASQKGLAGKMLTYFVKISLLIKIYPFTLSQLLSTYQLSH